MNRSSRAIGALLVAMMAVPVTMASADPGPEVVPLNGSGDFGGLADVDLDLAIVGMAALPGGDGYWLVASDGGVFAFGDAGFFGSTGAIALVSPMVDMAPTPDGGGYWLVASDGGVFSYGNAAFWGSAGAISLTEPVVGMATTPTGNGYWLVASDGGVFTYGDAQFRGSAGAIDLDSPIVAMAPTPSGGGYWLLGADGGVFTFGDATFYGSAYDPARALGALSIGVSSGGGYWILTGDGEIETFGPVDHDPAPSPVCSLVAVRGGAVGPDGVWLYSTPIDVPQPAFSSVALAIDDASIVEQLAYAQACQTTGEAEPGDFINPVPGSFVTSVFGPRLHPVWNRVILHTGTDITYAGGSFGRPIVAPADGVVVAVDSRTAYGTTVVIDHGDRVATVYAHLSSVDVMVGDLVSAGERFGAIGATGFVTGPNLHVEVRVNGVPVDPRPLLGL